MSKVIYRLDKTLRNKIPGIYPAQTVKYKFEKGILIIFLTAQK